jgi:hypothetical protein
MKAGAIAIRSSKPLLMRCFYRPALESYFINN